MNNLEIQPELSLQERPTTDVQRWSRLIPEHFRLMFQRHGWAQLPLEDLHRELKIHGWYEVAEVLIVRILAISENYTDDANVRLWEVFLWTEWLPSANPRVKLTPELFARLERIFVQLGCVHLYDIWALGRWENASTVERDEDVLELWEYLYEYATEVVEERIKSENYADEDVEETKLQRERDDFDLMRVMEKEELHSKRCQGPNQVHNHHDTYNNEYNSDNRQWIGFWKFAAAVAIASILSGTAMKRGWIHTERVSWDVAKIIAHFHSPEAPKAIPVASPSEVVPEDTAWEPIPYPAEIQGTNTTIVPLPKKAPTTFKKWK